MLDITALSLRYGKHMALNDISVQVGAGESVVILGANGAGKSSLLKAIAGLAQPDAGAGVLFNGTSLSEIPAHRRVEYGIALVPEGRGVFGELSVDENLSLGAIPRRARDGESQRRAGVYALFPKLAERRRQRVGTMSGGEQQMVAIGRALMSNPDLLLLDEPSLGLAPIVVGELFGALTKIRNSGVGLLIVEQNVKFSLSISDRGYLMEAGQIVGQGTAEQLSNSQTVKDAFLGSPGDPHNQTQGAIK
ncbi:MAG: ABC transporter ATP-binding protein [Rhodospirillales bacterium]|nr:ABC transporter ATP-binding protein [Rhodospirillales bacterium]